jgi:mRNA interferase MazF
MRRGDVIIVSAAGDYGKPRPAVIVQTDALPASHASVIICQMTPEVVDAPAFPVTIEPSAENGLRVRSQVMADKPTTVRRARLGPPIGRLAAQEISQLNAALTFAMGLAD